MTELALDAEVLEGFVHQLLPEKPLLTSRTAKLNNVFLAHYIHPGCHLDDHNTPFHVLEVIGNNRSSPHKRRFGDDTVSNQLCGGEIFFCPAGAGHEITWTKTMEFTLLAFHPKLFEEECNCNPHDFPPLFNIFDSHIQSFVINILRDIKEGCPAGSMYCDQQAVALASHLFFRHLNTSQKNIGNGFGRLSKNVLGEVLEYLRVKVNAGEDISLPDMAKVTGMPQRDFSELFQKSTEMTPHQYFDRLRLERAKCLLLTPNHNVTEVSSLCGFKDSAYFSRWFSKLVGLSPKKFQQDYWKSRSI